MSDSVTTLSIRVPRQMREIITAACNRTQMSRAQFIASCATEAANGIFNSGKSLKLLPEWFEPDERDRKMVTITMYPQDLELTQAAAKRMMIPHTRFILWAVSLISLHELGKKSAKEIHARVRKELRAEEKAA